MYRSNHSTGELIDFATLNHLRLAGLQQAIALLVVPAGQRWEIYRMVEE